MKAKVGILSVVLIGIALAVLIFKPIPSCLASAFGFCVVPNPILVFTLGINPNFILAVILIAGAVYPLIMHSRRGRRGAASKNHVTQVLGLILAVTALLDLVLPFLGILLLSGVAVQFPGTNQFVIPYWGLAFIVLVIGVWLILISRSGKGGR